VLPPLVIEAVKLTLVPEQTFGVVVLMLIVGVTLGVTFITMVELVTTADVVHAAFEVSVHETASPLFKLEVVNVLAVPTVVPFIFQA
jgi:hypothetical protein